MVHMTLGLLGWTKELRPSLRFENCHRHFDHLLRTRVDNEVVAVREDSRLRVRNEPHEFNGVFRPNSIAFALHDESGDLNGPKLAGWEPLEIPTKSLRVLRFNRRRHR